MARVWSDKDIAKMVALKERTSARAVAKMFGTTRNAVIGVWFRHRNPPPLRVHKRASVVNADLARAMRWNGASLREIGEFFGVTSGAVHRHVQDVICPVEHRGRRKAA